MVRFVATPIVDITAICLLAVDEGDFCGKGDRQTSRLEDAGDGSDHFAFAFELDGGFDVQGMPSECPQTEPFQPNPFVFLNVFGGLFAQFQFQPVVRRPDPALRHTFK